MHDILVIDCGATTCKYSHILKKEIVSGSTSGYSPVSNDISSFPEFKLKLIPENIYFFGTAVNKKNETIIRNTISSSYPNSKIHVASDSLAAALATCGNNSGYIHILGTGSSVNFWNGKKLTHPKLNLGYIWEDFASGYDIGKTIIEKWNDGELSLKERLKLEDKAGEIRTFVQNTYKHNPKTFLAKASLLINLLEPKTQKSIINERLEQYFKKNIDNFASRNKHHFIGSMAYLFKDEITFMMNNRSKELGKILPDTMNGLISYFQNKIT